MSSTVGTGLRGGDAAGPRALPDPAPDLEALQARAAERERAGDWAGAAAAFGAVFGAAARAGRLEPAADALRGQARVRQQEERLDEAEELAELSLEISERAGLGQAAARAVNTLAAIHYLRRDYAGARRLFEAALERALDLGDDVLTGWTCQNLGVLANIRGDLREARTRYLEGIGSFVRSRNKRNAAQVYNNLGMVCADLHDWMEAEVCFDRGIEIAGRLSDVPLLAKLYANRAEPLLRLRDFGRARASLDQARSFAARVDARETLADVARFRGMLSAAEGEAEEAAQHFRSALSIARAAGLALEEAEALRELGVFERSRGRHADGRAALQEARAIFVRLGAERDAERVDELLAGAGRAAA